MNVRAFLLSTAFFLLSSVAAAQSPASLKLASSRVKEATAPLAKPAVIDVPSGTKIPLVLENAISTRTARAGDPVYFQTLYPILVAGHIAIPAGSYMSGQVLSAKRPGRIRGRGKLVLTITQLILPNGYAASLVGAPSDVGTGGGEKTGKEGQIEGPTSRATDAGIIIRSTVYGAGIGAAAAGAAGAKSGLGIGAAAGLLGVLLTRGPDAELPRGTTMNVVLDRPIPLPAAKVRFKSPGQAPD
ncbi:MAG TPA: hypothetical protein VNJ12_00755, partial [Candidatus Dormibacteraeota bacterium]|nr:hypothetical protein [Candidatus Dormibacteraeota bacterium]